MAWVTFSMRLRKLDSPSVTDAPDLERHVARVVDPSHDERVTRVVDEGHRLAIARSGHPDRGVQADRVAADVQAVVVAAGDRQEIELGTGLHHVAGASLTLAATCLVSR